MNQNELSNHSATLNGTATIIDENITDISDRSATKFFKEKHLSNNPEAECFIKADNIYIIKIKISKAKVSDSTNKIAE